LIFKPRFRKDLHKTNNAEENRIWKMKNRKSKYNSGVAILFAVLLMGILLSIILTLSSIFTPKIRASFDVGSSTGAIYAAESAAEWCLYVSGVGPAEKPVMFNGAVYKNGLTEPPSDFSPTGTECTNNIIRTIGTYRGTSRSYELNQKL
jgi:hypothetical protein